MVFMSVSLSWRSRVDCSTCATPSSMVGVGCRIEFQPEKPLPPSFNIGRIAWAASYHPNSCRRCKACPTTVDSFLSITTSFGGSSNCVTGGDVSKLLAQVSSGVTYYNQARKNKGHLYHQGPGGKREHHSKLMVRGVR